VKTAMNTMLYLLCLLSLALPFQPVVAFEFSGSFPDRDYPLPVKDSGVEVQVDEATVVEWIDDEKVIFSALKPGEPRLQGKGYHADRKDHFAPGRVVVWNTRTDEIKDLGEGKLYCAYRGYVSYYWEDPNPTSGNLKLGSKRGFTEKSLSSRVIELATLRGIATNLLVNFSMAHELQPPLNTGPISSAFRTGY